MFVEADEKVGDTQLHRHRSPRLEPKYSKGGEPPQGLPQINLDKESLRIDKVCVLDSRSGGQDQARLPLDTEFCVSLCYSDLTNPYPTLVIHVEENLTICSPCRQYP
jgi:hypothetical protein